MNGVVSFGLTGAVSRKVHGPAGVFDLPLALTPLDPSTEPRRGPSATVVFTFAAPIISASVAVTEGVATLSTLTLGGNDVIVDLSGVADQQYVTVALSNVTSAVDSGGGASVRIGFLAGDATTNRVVTLADLSEANALLSNATTKGNYLLDVNASGTVSVADVGITAGNLTKALPPP